VALFSFKLVQPTVIVKDQRFLKSSKDGHGLHDALRVFDRMTVTFGCTDLNETNANILYFESSFTYPWI
jgi:hypothetical protein